MAEWVELELCVSVGDEISGGEFVGFPPSMRFAGRKSPPALRAYRGSNAPIKVAHEQLLRPVVVSLPCRDVVETSRFVGWKKSGK